MQVRSHCCCSHTSSIFCIYLFRRWKNADRIGAAREYRRAIGFGTDAVALAREWPTSLFATHPVTGPGQVPVSLLLSARLSATRSNLAVLEGTSTMPEPGVQFARVTKVAASDARPCLVDRREQLSIATGPVCGSVCDSCGSPRPADSYLKMCGLCELASYVLHAAALRIHAPCLTDSQQVLQRCMPANALAQALHRMLRKRHILTRRHCDSA